MKYKIKSFIVGVKEGRRVVCTTVYGRPARKAYDMGEKTLQWLYGSIEGGNGVTKATKWRSRRG